MDIEQLATSAIKLSISGTEHLKTFINDNDKEPSWDGYIYIYDNIEDKKEGIKRVPVQVKGKKSNSSSPKSCKYSASVVDLDNWNRDGGIVLFVVLIEDEKKQTIYYDALLPIKIKNYLKCNQGKTRISIRLKRFPDDNEEKEAIFKGFYKNKIRQASFVDRELHSLDYLKENGLLKAIVPIPTYSADTIDKRIFQNDIYLYAQIKDLNTLYPLPETVENARMTCEKEVTIKVKDKAFYEKIELECNKDNLIIKFGKSLKLYPESDKTKIGFNTKGCLSDYIRDTEFLIALIKNKEVVMGNDVIQLDNLKGPDIKEYEQKLLYYYDIRQMLNKFGVKGDLDFDVATEEDFKNICNFTIAMVKGSAIFFHECDSSTIYGCFKLANLMIMIWADRQKNGEYILQNFFDKHQVVKVDENDKNVKHQITQYILMTKDSFLLASNIDYEKIVEDLSVNSKSVTDDITWLFFEMLRAYDEQENKNEELLLTAEKYSDWLTEIIGKTNEMILNKLQIIKRRRAFDSEEISFLQNLRKNTDNIQIKCGANLLLGKKEVAQDCFDEMDEEDKEVFITYPVCRFGEIEYEKRNHMKNSYYVEKQ